VARWAHNALAEVCFASLVAAVSASWAHHRFAFEGADVLLRTDSAHVVASTGAEHTRLAGQAVILASCVQVDSVEAATAGNSLTILTVVASGARIKLEVLSAFLAVVARRASCAGHSLTSSSFHGAVLASKAFSLHTSHAVRASRATVSPVCGLLRACGAQISIFARVADIFTPFGVRTALTYFNSQGELLGCIGGCVDCFPAAGHGQTVLSTIEGEVALRAVGASRFLLVGVGTGLTFHRGTGVLGALVSTRASLAVVVECTCVVTIRTLRCLMLLITLGVADDTGHAVPAGFAIALTFVRVMERRAGDDGLTFIALVHGRALLASPVCAKLNVTSRAVLKIPFMLIRALFAWWALNALTHASLVRVITRGACNTSRWTQTFHRRWAELALFAFCADSTSCGCISYLLISSRGASDTCTAYLVIETVVARWALDLVVPGGVCKRAITDSYGRFRCGSICSSRSDKAVFLASW